MLEKMAMAVVSAFLATVALAAQPNKNATHKEAYIPEKNPPAILARPDHQKNGEPDHSKAGGDSPRSNAPLKDPNWVLVIVGSVTCVVICWQSFETRKAAQGAKESAKATLLNIQAFINSERPWIQVIAEPQRESKMCWDVKAVNRGRTPAAIISECFDCSIVGCLEFPSLPPKYKRETGYSEPRILLPTEQLILHTLTRRDFGLREEDSKRFDSFELEAHVIGAVFYRNVLVGANAETYETHWCLRGHGWQEGILLHALDFEEYAKHT